MPNLFSAFEQQHAPDKTSSVARGLAEVAHAAWSCAAREVQHDMVAGKNLIPGKSAIKDAVSILCPLTIVGLGAGSRCVEARASQFHSDPQKAALESLREVTSMFSPILPIIDLTHKHESSGVAAGAAAAGAAIGAMGADILAKTSLHPNHDHHKHGVTTELGAAAAVGAIVAAAVAAESRKHNSHDHHKPAHQIRH